MQKRKNDGIFVLGVWDDWYPPAQITAGGASGADGADGAASGVSWAASIPTELRPPRMGFTDGDACGDISRSATVSFECGASEFELKSVAEPSTCQYTLDFRVPISCELIAAGDYTTREPGSRGEGGAGSVGVAVGADGAAEKVDKAEAAKEAKRLREEAKAMQKEEKRRLKEMKELEKKEKALLKKVKIKSIKFLLLCHLLL